MDISVSIRDFKISPPIICASGTFGYGEELKDLVDFKNIGAITTKTITLKPKTGNPPPRIYETSCGVLNSIGLENPGLEVFLKEKLPKLKSLNTKFIVSIGGFSFDEYLEILKELEKIKDIEAIEINLSCPNIKLKRMISQDKELTYNLLKRLRKISKKVLIAKITPEVTDILEIAKAVKKADIDAISLVNTFFGLAIDINSQKPYLGNIYGGYSSRAIKPLALYRVWRIYNNLKIPIIGGGGIEDASSAIEFFLAGAKAISLGTINLVYPNIAKKILDSIKLYLKEKNIDDINKLIGKLKCKEYFGKD